MSLSKWKIHVYLVSLNMKYRDGWKQTRVNRLSKCTYLLEANTTKNFVNMARKGLHFN